MQQSNPQIEWTLARDQEDRSGESTHGTDSAEESAPAYLREKTRQRHLLRRVYELIVSVAIIYGIVLFFLWQQTEKLVTQLESELATLQGQFQQSLLEATPSAPEAPAAIGPDEFEALLVEAIKTPDVQPQWWLLSLALFQYVQRENGPDADWQNEPVFLHRRHLAQRFSIDLTLQTTGALLRQMEYENGNPEAMYQSDRVQFRPSTAHVIADPLVEYILETHGYARIPALLHGFETYDDWDDLAPAVLDVSASQFEEEWHEYLRQRYPRSEE